MLAPCTILYFLTFCYITKKQNIGYSPASGQRKSANLLIIQTFAFQPLVVMACSLCALSHITPYSVVFCAFGAPELHHFKRIFSAWCNMGTIVKRTTTTGEVRYRAQIRVKREGYPDFSESRTFSRKTLAQEWIKRRELEIERDESILAGQPKRTQMTLRDAARRYLEEVSGKGRSVRQAIGLLQTFPIASIPINELKKEHYAALVKMRRSGMDDLGLDPIAASTAQQDLQYIRIILNHADMVWGEEVSIHELDKSMKGMRDAGMISRSKKRDRTPTAEELQDLTTYFFSRYRRKNSQPMHLIMWLAIYTCRRQAELCRMRLDDYHPETHDWLIRDLKNPNGSDGNHHLSVITDTGKKVIDLLLDPELRKRQGWTDSPFLFEISNKMVCGYFTEACKMLGIVDLHFHDLRHEGATRYAEDGLNVPQLQRITLHESWSSLERYVNVRRRRGHRLEMEEALKCAGLPSL